MMTQINKSTTYTVYKHTHDLHSCQFIVFFCPRVGCVMAIYKRCRNRTCV